MTVKKRFHQILEMNKDLLLLKAAFFILYGMGTNTRFVVIYFKEHGFSMSHLALMYMISPFVQFALASTCGIIADKMGRSKPILLSILFLYSLTYVFFLLIPIEGKAENHDFSGKCCCPIKPNASTVDLTDFCDQINKEFKNVSVEYKLSSLNKALPLQINAPCKISCPPTDTRNSQNKSFNCCEVLALAPTVSNHELPFITEFLSFITLMFYTVVGSTSFRFADVLAMSMTNTHCVDYGKIRFWGILGLVILSPLFGLLVQISTPAGGPKNVTGAFYSYSILLVATIILFWFIRVEDKPPGRHMWRNSILLVKNVDVLGFYFIILVSGTGYILFSSYAPLYLNELGASSILLSLSPTVSGLAGLPCLFTSNWWMKKLGHENLLLAALVTYSLMCLGYALIVNPWFALLIATGSVFTYHLLMVALLRHSDDIAPPGLTSTVIATAGALHFAIGKATAGIIGGYFMPLRPRWGFGVMGGLSAVTAFLGFVFFRIRRKMRQMHLKSDEREYALLLQLSEKNEDIFN